MSTLGKQRSQPTVLPWADAAVNNSKTRYSKSSVHSFDLEMTMDKWCVSLFTPIPLSREPVYSKTVAGKPWLKHPLKPCHEAIWACQFLQITWIGVSWRPHEVIVEVLQLSFLTVWTLMLLDFWLVYAFVWNESFPSVNHSMIQAKMVLDLDTPWHFVCISILVTA